MAGDQISDEIVDAYDDAEALGVVANRQLSGWPLRAAAIRAGLAAALVASGYRPEADVLREAAADIRNTVSFPWGPGGDPEDWCDAIAAHLERRAQTLEPAQPLPVADGSEADSVSAGTPAEDQERSEGDDHAR